MGVGLEGSVFSFGETSLCVLHLSCERGMEGKAAEWAYGGMTQGAQRSLPYPDISPVDGVIHVFPTLGTFLWYLATRVFHTASEYLTKYCVLEILSNILYHIEYFSDHTRWSADCPTSQTNAYLSTFSIAHLICSTSHLILKWYPALHILPLVTSHFVPRQIGHISTTSPTLVRILQSVYCI